VAAPLGSLVATGGFVVLNTFLGGALTSTFVVTVVERPLGLGLLLCVLVATVALARPRRDDPSRSGSALVVVPAAAALCAIAAAGLAIATQASLVPSVSVTITPTSATTYVATVVPEITTRYSAAEEALQSIASSSGDGRVIAQRVRTEVLEPMQLLVQDARLLRFDDPAVSRVHEESVIALELAVQAFTDYADAHERGDSALLEQAIRLRTEETEHWEQWQAGIAQLVSG
jgi:hypothetical protein